MGAFGREGENTGRERGKGCIMVVGGMDATETAR